jgi:hypothetical protein
MVMVVVVRYASLTHPTDLQWQGESLIKESPCL